MTSNSILRALPLLPALLCGGCAVAHRSVERGIADSQLKRPATPMSRPIQTNLADFGKLLRVFTSLEDRDITVEIDFLPNDSGIQKELPADLGLYARKVLSDIGNPLRSSRTLPSSALLPYPAGAAIPFQQKDQPRPPYTFRLVGSLQRASERLVVGREVRADGLTNGKPRTDGQFTNDQRRTLTGITVLLGLDGADGLSVPGGTAQYQVLLEKNELNRSVSIYVGGSGLGAGTKLVATQDTGEAFYDAIASGVMHVLGNALMVPYYRTSPAFPEDEPLNRRMRESLARMTQSELEQTIKRYLFASGFDMDMRGPDLTLGDRAVVVVEMRSRSLDFGKRDDVIEFAFRQWRDMDYAKAADRIEARLARTAQLARERAEQEERAKAAERAAPPGPETFGWPASERVVLLDLSRVKEPEIRAKILELARTCTGCEELRSDTTKALAGIRMSAHSSEVQTALGRGPWPIYFVWADHRQQGLILIPLWR